MSAAGSSIPRSTDDAVPTSRNSAGGTCPRIAVSTRSTPTRSEAMHAHDTPGTCKPDAPTWVELSRARDTTVGSPFLPPTRRARPGRDRRPTCGVGRSLRSAIVCAAARTRSRPLARRAIGRKSARRVPSSHRASVQAHQTIETPRESLVVLVGRAPEREAMHVEQLRRSSSANTSWHQQLGKGRASEPASNSAWYRAAPSKSSRRSPSGVTSTLSGQASPGPTVSQPGSDSRVGGNSLRVGRSAAGGSARFDIASRSCEIAKWVAWPRGASNSSTRGMLRAANSARSRA